MPRIFTRDVGGFRRASEKWREEEGRGEEEVGRFISTASICRTLFQGASTLPEKVKRDTIRRATRAETRNKLADISGSRRKPENQLASLSLSRSAFPDYLPRPSLRRPVISPTPIPSPLPTLLAAKENRFATSVLHGGVSRELETSPCLHSCPESSTSLCVSPAKKFSHCILYVSRCEVHETSDEREKM